VLVNPRGTVGAQGQNTVFYRHFRSDLHAEMVVMNAFEEQHPEVTMRGYTLLCSLKPCPMCFARLLAAGVQTVKFLAEDTWEGMVNHRQYLPAAWQRLGQRQAIGQAEVSKSLRQFALDTSTRAARDYGRAETEKASFREALSRGSGQDEGASFH